MRQIVSQFSVNHGIGLTGGDIARGLLCLFTGDSRDGRAGRDFELVIPTRWECSLAAGWCRPVSALPPVSRDCRFDV
jgi:hypothetical protein